jgi:Zn-dependent peptidase ImmA (M78 family)
MHLISANRRRVILREARKLLRALREELRDALSSDSPELIDPQVIITKILGLSYSEPEEIPPQPGHDRIAGLMDRKKREIAVVRGQKPEVKRFTAAHEIGHWILHTGREYFRDSPIDGSNRDQERSLEEREADHFAAALLMPTNFMREAFRQHFERRTLADAPIDGELIALLGQGIDEKIRPSKPSELRSTRQISNLAAQCLSVFRPSSPSLAKRFKVSSGAMAIRLEELRLVPFLPGPKEVAQSNVEDFALAAFLPKQKPVAQPSPEPETYDAFISYRREDRIFVERLVAKLHKRGLHPWFDRFIIPGRFWRRQVEDAIKWSRAAVIVLSPLGYDDNQELEVEAILDDYMKKGYPIIPVLIPGWSEEMRVPYSLKGFHHVDFREADTDALEKLIQGITDGGQPKRSS